MGAKSRLFLRLVLAAVCFAGVFGATHLAHAARLYLDPATGTYGKGDTFGVRVRIDAEGECINTISARIRYSRNILRAVDVSQGGSILTLWVEEPAIDETNGLISFAGGIPGGYCGSVPGDVGDSNVLATLLFRIPGFSVGEEVATASSAQISFTGETKAFLNDGQGTQSSLALENAVFLIGDTSGTGSSDTWRAALRNDAAPPEEFTFEIMRDPKLFHGEYFIVFSTTDKQTGIDRYEVYEADAAGRDPGTKAPAEWVRVDAPYYILKDQTLNSVVKVRAVDKAGNETVISAPVPESFTERVKTSVNELQRKTILMLAGLGLLALAIAAWLIYRIRHHRKLQKQ